MNVLTGGEGFLNKQKQFCWIKESVLCLEPYEQKAVGSNISAIHWASQSLYLRSRSFSVFIISKCWSFLLAWQCASICQFMLTGSLASELITFSKVKHSLVLAYDILARLFLYFPSAQPPMLKRSVSVCLVIDCISSWTVIYWFSCEVSFQVAI